MAEKPRRKTIACQFSDVLASAQLAVNIGRFITLAGFCGLFALAATTALAHHAASGYDKSRPVTLKGVVTEWRWSNPHTFLVWKVTDDKGWVTEWTGEMASPMIMTSLGLTRI